MSHGLSSRNPNNPFDECSSDYAQFRPGYPLELHEYLVNSADLKSNSLVLDAGAGTGKASIPFLKRDIPVVSVEPSYEMALQGIESYPNLRYAGGRAEELPFSGGAFDLITSAQSFHWFQADAALPEFARTLRDGRFFAAFWNNRDLGRRPTQAFERLVGIFNPEHRCAYRRKDWGEVLQSTGHFTVIDHVQFRFVAPMTIDDWIGLARSISYVRTIGAAKMEEFEATLRHDLSSCDSVDLEYITHCWFAQKNSANVTAFPQSVL